MLDRTAKRMAGGYELSLDFGQAMSRNVRGPLLLDGRAFIPGKCRPMIFLPAST
jgi:hypothetical protein